MPTYKNFVTKIFCLTQELKFLLKILGAKPKFLSVGKLLALAFQLQKVEKK